MSTPLKILVAEDDKNLGILLTTFLKAKGYEPVLFENGALAAEGFKKDTFAFCILDVMMPQKDGFEVAREIRETDKKVPLLFLTAKSMKEDILKGFQLGGDDYLTKPFEMEELLARIQAILKRSSMEKDHDISNFTIGKFEFDHTRQILKIGDKEQKLTSRESELLKLLSVYKNEILDRTEALNKIWLDDSYFNARSMDVYITRLRKYLRQDPDVELINVHGIGFKLVAK